MSFALSGHLLLPVPLIRQRTRDCSKDTGFLVRRPEGAATSQPRATPWDSDATRSPSPVRAKHRGTLVSPFQGSGWVWARVPRALPWANLFGPFRANSPARFPCWGRNGAETGAETGTSLNHSFGWAVWEKNGEWCGPRLADSHVPGHSPNSSCRDWSGKTERSTTRSPPVPCEPGLLGRRAPEAVPAR